jgi:hypothetical protein
VKLTKGAFANALADDGVAADAATGTGAIVPVTVIFNGISYQRDASLTNNGTQWQLAKKK